MKRCDLTFVKATNRGGRLHSAVYEAKDLYNGTIGYLGDYVEGSTEIRKFLKPTTQLVAGAMPVIVMKPEVVYDEKKRKLGDFINVKGKAFPVVPLENLDGFDLSADYFNVSTKDAPSGGGARAVAVGDKFIIKAEADEVGTQFEYIKGAVEPSTHACYFKVIGIKESHFNNLICTDGTNNSLTLPQPYKMVALEVVKTTV